MRNLTAFLSKYTQIKAPERTIKIAFTNAVRAVVGADVSPKDLVVKKKTVTVNVPATLKHEIRLHQQDILKHVEMEVGSSATLTAIY
jgi:hypothetical protein